MTREKKSGRFGAFIEGALIGSLVARLFIYFTSVSSTEFVMKVDLPNMSANEVKILSLRMAQEPTTEQISEMVRKTAEEFELPAERLEGLTVEVDKR